MKVKASNLYSIFYAVLVFFYSIFLLPFYYGGDQYHYRNFYENCFHNIPSIEDQFACYKFTLSSQEPIYFFLAKMANPFLSKDIFIALANSFFTFILVKLIFKYHKRSYKIHIFIFLILTNYYLNVLFFAAERLKFGFIFLMLALLLTSKKTSLMARILMMFSHLQMILVQLVFMLGESFSINKEESSSKRRLKKTLIITVGIISFIILYLKLGNQLSTKFESYNQSVSESDEGIIGFIKAFMFLILTYLSTRRVFPMILQLPFIIAAILLGPARIIIMSVILYITSVIYYRKKPDFILVIVLTYFSYKTVGFIKNILNFGSGYT